MHSDIALLEGLYKSYLQNKSDTYLHDHSSNKAVIRRQIEAFYLYKQAIFPTAKVLDWGCRHAIDSCLMRHIFGSQIDLYGCDVGSPQYSAFFEFASLKYSVLKHPYLLPYDDNYFDIVVGSGVLEHVPDEGASLRELYRILKPEGCLVITFLPNNISYTEFLNRHLGNFYHVRRYTVNGIRRYLLQHGFLPMSAGYHQITPTLSSGMALANYAVARKFVEILYHFNSALERLWPINKLAANIFIISKKKTFFSDSWD